jgi:hypothetical protein
MRKKRPLKPAYRAEHIPAPPTANHLRERNQPPDFNDPVVHRHRNIFSHVPSTKMREIVAMLKAIHASEDIAAAREKGCPSGREVGGATVDQGRRTRGHAD